MKNLKNTQKIVYFWNFDKNSAKNFLALYITFFEICLIFCFAYIKMKMKGKNTQKTHIFRDFSQNIQKGGVYGHKIQGEFQQH